MQDRGGASRKASRICCASEIVRRQGVNQGGREAAARGCTPSAAKCWTGFAKTTRQGLRPVLCECRGGSFAPPAFLSRLRRDLCPCHGAKVPEENKDEPTQRH